ncbi:putative transporter [Tolypocladium ophioglossoides CBS 100239]|uniref:Putative transporter n=1 Tax=Tolypocladium ophioglossoides (strain CBS 100239) TaxID=1163406 RepID=A0A0L0NH50_TOLOC|nr:putative transporter [Tolypocladium ophioglossoides CBS 100239]
MPNDTVCWRHDFQRNILIPHTSYTAPDPSPQYVRFIDVVGLVYRIETGSYGNGRQSNGRPRPAHGPRASRAEPGAVVEDSPLPRHGRRCAPESAVLRQRLARCVGLPRRARHGLHVLCKASARRSSRASWADTARSILPALAFSLDMFQKTGSNYGVNEVLLASVLGAVVFSLFAAQPLVIVGVTGEPLSEPRRRQMGADGQRQVRLPSSISLCGPAPAGFSAC